MAISSNILNPKVSPNVKATRYIHRPNAAMLIQGKMSTCEMAERSAEQGMVRNQAISMSRAMSQCTPLRLCAVPTPMTVEAMICEAETGPPVADPIKTTAAEANSLTKPWIGRIL
jgi:hypothetical protein